MARRLLRNEDQRQNEYRPMLSESFILGLSCRHLIYIQYTLPCELFKYLPKRTGSPTFLSLILVRSVTLVHVFRLNVISHYRSKKFKILIKSFMGDSGIWVFLHIFFIFSSFKNLIKKKEEFI